MTESLQELDRRRFVRFPVTVPVVGRAAQVGELELRGTVRNISGGGLMAEFAIQVQHGSTVYLTLEAEEAGEVPGGLLTELRDELQAAEQRGEDAGHAVVVRQVADLAGIDRKLAAEVLDTIEAQRSVTGEMLMRRIAEAWLEGQREAHERTGP